MRLLLLHPPLREDDRDEDDRGDVPAGTGDALLFSGVPDVLAGNGVVGAGTPLTVPPAGAPAPSSAAGAVDSVLCVASAAVAVVLCAGVCVCTSA